MNYFLKSLKFPYILWILPLFTLFSCSFYINKLEKNREVEIIKKSSRTLHCDKSYKQSTYREKSKHKFITRIIKKIEKDYSFKFVDLLSINTLVNMYLNPIAYSPISRFTLIAKVNGKVDFLDIYGRPENKNFPLLKGLNNLLISNNSKYNLEHLNQLVYKNLPSRLPVFTDLESDIIKNKAILSSNNLFKAMLFITNEPLKSGETFKKSQVKQLIPSLRTFNSSDYYEFTSLIKNEFARCNFDSNAYEKGVYFLETQIPTIRPLLLQKGKDIAILFSSYQKASTSEGPQNSLGLTSSAKGPTVCITNDKLLATYASRDSGQIMHQLLKANITQSKNEKELSQKIEDARLLLLPSPRRIIYEDERGTSKHLESLLNLETNVYHVDSIGISLGALTGSTIPKIVIDSRSDFILECVK